MMRNGKPNDDVSSGTRDTHARRPGERLCANEEEPHWYLPRRSDQQYCNASCRSKASRARNTEPNGLEDAHLDVTSTLVVEIQSLMKRVAALEAARGSQSSASYGADKAMAAVQALRNDIDSTPTANPDYVEDLGDRFDAIEKKQKEQSALLRQLAERVVEVDEQLEEIGRGIVEVLS